MEIGKWRLVNVTLKELEMEERVGGSPRKTNFYRMYVTYSDIYIYRLLYSLERIERKGKSTQLKDQDSEYQAIAI